MILNKPTASSGQNLVIVRQLAKLCQTIGEHVAILHVFTPIRSSSLFKTHSKAALKSI